MTGNNHNRFYRRDFLRLYARVAGVLIVLPILSGPPEAGLIEKTKTPLPYYTRR